MKTLALQGYEIYDKSITEHDGTTYFLAHNTADNTQVLGIQGDAAGFEGAPHGDLTLCHLTPQNTTSLREVLPWLRPSPLGLQTSAGFLSHNKIKDSSAPWITSIFYNEPQLDKRLVKLQILLFIFRTRTI